MNVAIDWASAIKAIYLATNGHSVPRAIERDITEAVIGR